MPAGRTIGGDGQRLDLHREGAPPGEGERRGRAGGVAAGHEIPGGLGLDQPTRPHLKPGHLAFLAEAVLPAGQHTEPRTRISLERQHGVDGMLQGPGARDVAFLRDVARQEHRDPLGLGQADQGVRATPDLGRSTGRRGGTRVPDRLDGVHGHQERPPGSSGVEHVRQLAAGQERNIPHLGPQTGRPGRDLVARLLARSVEAGEPGGGQSRHHVEEKGRLADAGLTRQEGHRRGHQPAADAGQTGADSPARAVAARDAGQGLHRPGATAPGRRRTLGPFGDGSPCPAARAPSGPLRHLLPAFGALEQRPGPDPTHDPTVAGGYDIQVRSWESDPHRCTKRPTDDGA